MLDNVQTKLRVIQKLTKCNVKIKIIIIQVKKNQSINHTRNISRVENGDSVLNIIYLQMFYICVYLYPNYWTRLYPSSFSRKTTLQLFNYVTTC